MQFHPLNEPPLHLPSPNHALPIELPLSVKACLETGAFFLFLKGFENLILFFMFFAFFNIVFVSLVLGTTRDTAGGGAATTTGSTTLSTAVEVAPSNVAKSAASLDVASSSIDFSVVATVASVASEGILPSFSVAPPASEGTSASSEETLPLTELTITGPQTLLSSTTLASDPRQKKSENRDGLFLSSLFAATSEANREGGYVST